MKHFCSTSHIEKNKSLFKFVFLLIYLPWFRNIGLYNGCVYVWNLSYPDTHLMGIGDCMPRMWEVWSSSTSDLACCGHHGQFWGHYSFFSSVTIPSAPWDNVYWDNMSLFDVTLFAYSSDGIHIVSRKNNFNIVKKQLFVWNLEDRMFGYISFWWICFLLMSFYLEKSFQVFCWSFFPLSFRWQLP